MITYVSRQGLVPNDGDFLGTWDDVGFTVAEAEATLAFANKASYDLLDVDLELDRRAASSIIAAQPVESIEHLAGLYYVGHTALSTLKDEAVGTPVSAETGVPTASSLRVLRAV